MEIETNKTMILPQAARDQGSLSIRIITAQNINASAEEPFGVLRRELSEMAHEFLIQIPDDPSVVSLPVSLRYCSADGSVPHRLAIGIPIRRLRWQLRLRGLRRSRPSWSDHVLSVSLEELEQADECCLVVDIPAEHSMTMAALELVADGKVLQEVTSESLNRQVRFCQFDLRRILSTAQEAPDQAMTARLVVHNLREQAPHRYDVLSVYRGIRLESLQVHMTDRENGPLLDCTWEPDVRLQGRHLRLWPLARPWAPPLDTCIPDTCDGNHAWAVEPEALVDGRYRAELTVIDPWLPSAAQDIPGPDAPNAVDTTIGKPHTRLLQLARIADESDGEFTDLAEALLLARLLDDPLETELAEGCTGRMRTAPLDVAIRLIEALGPHPSASRMARMLFSPARVYEAIESFTSGTLDRVAWLAYLRLCPRPEDLRQPELEALLDLPEGNMRFEAANALLDRGSPSPVYRVLDWLTEGELGIEDAVGLFSHNPTLASRTLSQMPVSDDLFRLLDHLGKAYSESIMRIVPGQWVRTQAGWARIDRIKSETGEALDWIWKSRLNEDCTLYMTLRPDQQDEDNLSWHADGTLEFTRRLYGRRATRRYLCGKCESFITRVQECIRDHDRTVHEGMSRQLLPLRHIRIHHDSALEFSIRPPRRIWE